MIEALSQYVRNIAVFLLFISFVGIIVPNNKYKGYINLVMGFMLIFIMLAPISGIVANSYLTVDDILAEIEHEINVDVNTGDILSKQEFYQSAQQSIVLDTFRRELITQVEEIVKKHGFSPIKITIEVNDQPQNFGEIKSIYIHMLKTNKEGTVNPVVKVEKISINDETPQTPHLNEEKSHYEEVKKLKNYISDFYNLSVSNIHITIQD